MYKRKAWTAVSVWVALATAGPLAAAETGGCESFAWPVKTEIEWMQSADTETLSSGARLSTLPAKAIALSLQPMSKVAFPAPPTGKPKDGQGELYGGFIDVAGGDAGVYQISLARGGWIDVVQNGKTLKPSAHTGKSDCAALRKSVRFELAGGPFSVEITGIPKDAVKFAIKRAE